MQGAIIAGAGYTLPYLESASSGGAQTFVILPGQMGALAWPTGGAQRCVLSESGSWPLPGASLDLIVMAHELEYAADPASVLDEAWRVLKPEGRLLLVVPNRTGLWARAEKTPFGHGRPFTSGQLYEILREREFTLDRMTGALLAPPLRFVWYNRRVAPILEYLAPFMSRLCGVVLVDARKRLFAPIPGKAKPVTAKAAAWVADKVPVPGSIPQGN
ncbi:MAG TPA: class I SAM-dependent methyltransferase, partial [Alphaproteobacteria bacterium]